VQLELPAIPPVDGAERTLARFEARLRREARTVGLTLWTGALRLWLGAIRRRDAQACEQLMLLEHEIEVGRDRAVLQERLGRVKGLLAGVMLALVLLQVVDGELLMRRPGGRSRRRDEIEEVLA